MPTYTYHCEKCGCEFDIFQKFSANPLTDCPKCSAVALRKVYAPVGIVFKGSGFYATDNRSPSGQSSNGTHHEPTESPAKTADKTEPSVAKTTDTTPTTKAAE